MGKLASMIIAPLGGPMKADKSKSKAMPEVEIDAGGADDEGDESSGFEDSWKEFAEKAGLPDSPELCEMFRGMIEQVVHEEMSETDSEEADEEKAAAKGMP